MTIVTALVATLLLTSSGPKSEPPHDEEREHHQEREHEHAGAAPAPEAIQGPEAPPGTPAELELWTRGVTSTRLLHAARTRATRLQTRATAHGTLAALDRLGKSEGPSQQQAKAAHRRIMETGRVVVATLKQQWPVDPLRGCSAAVMDYESQLWNKKKATRDVYLPPVQKALASCVSKADAVLKSLEQVNAEFEAALDAGEALLRPAAKTEAGQAPAAGDAK